MRILKTLPGVVLGVSMFGATWYAIADNTGTHSTKVARVTTERTANAPASAILERSEYVFSAPPGANYADTAAMYQPIAEFLTRVTGKRFVYRYSDNWLTYSKEMTSGDYDIIFDSAAFNSWRIERINHTPLLRLPEDQVFVVVTRADNQKVAHTKQLAGQPVCAPLPPDVATLTLLSQFDNPARQPVIIGTDGWSSAYDGLVQRKCTGAVMSLKNLETIDRGSIKVLYQHRALPNQALSAGPRISQSLKAQIREALLTPPGQAATARLRTTYGGGELVPASGAEYSGLGTLLKNSLYYY
jgi:ABC-type phosphate/phosphonate transport system substrate-binding protein